MVPWSRGGSSWLSSASSCSGFEDSRVSNMECWDSQTGEVGSLGGGRTGGAGSQAREGRGFLSGAREIISSCSSSASKGFLKLLSIYYTLRICLADSACIICPNQSVRSPIDSVFLQFITITPQQLQQVQQMEKGQDILGDFDLNRSDHLWALRGTVVFYNFELKDLVSGSIYYNSFRYNDLKAIHQRLEQLSYELPPFPVTHFWIKTNKNPQLIEERRAGLQAYFSRVINDPYIRGYPEVKSIIALCRKRQNRKRKLSEDLKTLKSERTRCHSESRGKGREGPSREEWKRLRRAKGKR